MKENRESEDFYERLPRFVDDAPSLIGTNSMMPIKRQFEWRGRTFTLSILPAQLRPEATGEEEIRFPGAPERQLENTLRRLANESNRNFDRQTSTLRFRRSELIEEIAAASGGGLDLDLPGIEKSLLVLALAGYVLRSGAAEYYFHAIEIMQEYETGDGYYYRLVFSPLFFNRSQVFDSCFDD